MFVIVNVDLRHSYLGSNIVARARKQCPIR